MQVSIEVGFETFMQPVSVWDEEFQPKGIVGEIDPVVELAHLEHSIE